MQLVFFEEHLTGSSGGVEKTKETKRNRRVDLKALCDNIPFKHNNDMVERFELKNDSMMFLDLRYCVSRISSSSLAY